MFQYATLNRVSKAEEDIRVSQNQMVTKLRKELKIADKKFQAEFRTMEASYKEERVMLN